jgi:flavin-dependent dehydrogenase
MDVEITADVIIGADGPRSLVRARLFGGSPSFAYGLQCAMESGAAPIEAEVHFAPEYGAGYAWCFPKGAVVNAGLALHGAARRQSLRALRKDFVDRLHAEGKIASTRVLRWTGGVIPVSGPLASAVRGRTLLCGDAAGHAHPLTGAGVFTAITCGQMAGAAAAKALRDEDESALGRYDAEWRSLFGGFLERGLASVRELEAAAPEAYIELVRKAWSL